jgi:hypothetical protein
MSKYELIAMNYKNIVVIQMKQIFGNYKFKGKYKFGKTTIWTRGNLLESSTLRFIKIIVYLIGGCCTEDN